MNEKGHRARRVAAAVRARLSDQLARDVADPALASLIITEVSLPDDLSIARVKARLLVGGDDRKTRDRAMQHLSRVASRLRRGLGRGLGLKRVPELRFEYDAGADAEQRVSELLAEIAQENAKSR